MSYEYTLNSGQYVLTDAGKPIGRVLDEVALCFSQGDGTLHKHGSQEFVEAWAAAARMKLRDAGAQEMADAILVIRGRFLLDELNRCLSHTGFVGHLYAKAMAGQLEQLPFGAQSNPPAPEARPRALG